MNRYLEKIASIKYSRVLTLIKSNPEIAISTLLGVGGYTVPTSNIGREDKIRAHIGKISNTNMLTGGE